MFCGAGNARIVREDILALFVECPNCMARGPAVIKSRPDAVAQCAAAWNAGRKFGKVAVAKVPGGMPAHTCSLAERLRVIAESMYEGNYGFAEKAVLVLYDGRHARVITHNIDAVGVQKLLTSVLGDSSVRAATAIVQPPRS